MRLTPPQRPRGSRASWCLVARVTRARSCRARRPACHRRAPSGVWVRGREGRGGGPHTGRIHARGARQARVLWPSSSASLSLASTGLTENLWLSASQPRAWPRRYIVSHSTFLVPELAVLASKLFPGKITRPLFVMPKWLALLVGPLLGVGRDVGRCACSVWTPRHATASDDRRLWVASWRWVGCLTRTPHTRVSQGLHDAATRSLCVSCVKSTGAGAQQAG